MTVLDTEDPIDALTRFETTDDNVDFDMVVQGRKPALLIVDRRHSA